MHANFTADLTGWRAIPNDMLIYMDKAIRSWLFTERAHIIRNNAADARVNEFN